LTSKINLASRYNGANTTFGGPWITNVRKNRGNFRIAARTGNGTFMQRELRVQDSGFAFRHKTGANAALPCNIILLTDVAASPHHPLVGSAMHRGW
jgi:hypothetical protein